MKRLVTVFAMLAAIAAFGAVSTDVGTAAGTKAPFTPQIVVTNYIDGGGASATIYYVPENAPFSTSVARIGNVAVDATIIVCNPTYQTTGGCDVPIAWIDFTFTTKTGDYLRIAGSGPTGTTGHATGTRVPWTVIAGTGRFAHATGSGTLSYQDDSANHVMTLSFDGVLSLH